jgi:hypothetical protein
VTVVYPREASDVDLLVERLGAATPRLPRFRLRLGRVVRLGPEGDASLDVEDVDGGLSTLRALVLRPPFRAVAFRPHVTLVHPRRSRRGPELVQTGWVLPRAHEFVPDEVAITAFDERRWVVLATVRLAVGAPGP